MANGVITRSLIRNSENGEVNVSRFIAEHPDSQLLRNDLYKLELLGYISVDYGDDRIVAISLSDKLLRVI